MIQGFALILLVFFNSSFVYAQGPIESPRPTNTLLIRFKRNISVDEANKKLAPTNMGVSYKSYLVPGLFIVKPRVQNFNAQAARRALRGVTEIAYAEEDRPYRKNFAPMTPLFGAYKTKSIPNFTSLPHDEMVNKQWALLSPNGINPFEAWKYTVGHRKIIVAVLDTGIDRGHPELNDRVLPGYDFIDRSFQVTDKHGHGTHVAGIIGAKWDNQGIAGINREVSLLPIRVVPNDADETDENVILGLEYAVARGARVANCSFGKQSASHAVGEVISATGKFGLLVVVAAGNGGEDGRSDNINELPSFPASFRADNMITVAASDINGRMTSFSNYGLGRVDIAAPGSDILSTITKGEYDSWGGTSMAAPQVAGIAAIMLAANPRLNPYQVKQILMSTVRRSPVWIPLVTSGGQVDMSAAVKAAISIQ